MKAKRHAAAAVIAASVFLGPTAASAAACTQSDLTATWRVHITRGNLRLFCTFAVATNGNLSAVRQCISESSGARYTLQSGGKLTMSTPSACTFTGSFIVVNSGQSNTMTVKDGVLSKNHEVGSALGTFGTDGAAFELTRQ